MATCEQHWPREGVGAGAICRTWRAVLARLAAEFGVRVRLGLAQTVVEMRDVQAKAQLRRQAAEHVQQAH